MRSSVTCQINHESEARLETRWRKNIRLLRVTLSWITAHPSRWKTFVANRVTEIQVHIPMNEWHHLYSQYNPADYTIRGLFINELREFKKWWNGSKLRSQSEEERPAPFKRDKSMEGKIPERKIVAKTFTAITIENRYENLTRLLRITAYCLRWKTYTWSMKQSETVDNAINQRTTVAQNDVVSLKPFLDENGISRMDGRLANANIEFDIKLPIFLPTYHRLTTIIIDPSIHTSKILYHQWSNQPW